MSALDKVDVRILVALQADARLTNNDLAELISLSPSQCSRRRSRLEAVGCITGYRASVNREMAGVPLTSIIWVTLATHNADNAKSFKNLIADLPNVLEAHALTGETDYFLKIVTRDLKSLSTFINDVLLPHESVRNVKTSIVLETLKETASVPVSEVHTT